MKAVLKSFFKKKPQNGLLYAELSGIKPVEEPGLWDKVRDNLALEAKHLVNELQAFWNMTEEPEFPDDDLKPLVLIEKPQTPPVPEDLSMVSSQPCPLTIEFPQRSIAKPKTFAEYKALGLQHSDSEAMESLEKAALLAACAFELDELLAGPLSGANLSETLLLNIINSQYCEEYLRKKILKISYLTENVLIRLVNLCETEEEITLMLQNPHIPPSCFVELLYKNLTSSHLLQFLNFIPLSPLHIRIIFSLKAADSQVRVKLYQHQSLRTQTLFLLLNKSAPRTLEEVTVLLKIKKLPSDFILAKLDREGTAEYAVRNINTLLWNELFIAAFDEFQKYQFSGSLIAILRERDESLLAKLPFISLINQCTTEEGLDTLVALSPHMKTECLLALAKIDSLNTMQIDRLLTSCHMNAAIADILFKKENYSGKIGHWEWLTKKQYLFTLYNTGDPASFEEALLHSSLTKKDRENWLKSLNNAYYKAINALQSPPISDPKANLLAILGGLKAKAYEHFLQLPIQEEAGQVSITLYQELHALVNAYFKPQALNQQPQALFDNCQQAIDKASVVLAVHRGYKQIFFNFLKMICVLGTLGLAKKQLEDCRFFKPETDSIKEVNKIAICIQNVAEWKNVG